MDAIKRLKAEYQDLILHPLEGITAGPIGEDNFLLWKVVIKGPPGTCYEGGELTAKLRFPHTYPMKPPVMKFTCEMFHPNVYRDGRVSCSILYNSQDVRFALGRRLIRAEMWSPVQSVEKILLSVVSLLVEPDCEVVVNYIAAHVCKRDREKYNRTVKFIVERLRGPPPS